MSPLPQQLVDRWQHRSENGPGEGTVYWHILLGDNADLRSMAVKAHARLAKFSGLHQTPLRWLHITALIAGSTDEIEDNGMSRMLAEARTLLSDTAPIRVTFNRVLYHPEAIVLGVYPQGALAPIHEAALAATRAIIGRDRTVSDCKQPWNPHVTLCYQRRQQPGRTNHCSTWKGIADLRGQSAVPQLGGPARPRTPVGLASHRYGPP